MVNTLPAIVLGGPPHAGKSVLLHSLTLALHARHVPHYAIRACPDGEGNWFQEGDPETVSQVRKKNKGVWSDEFVQRMCLDLEHRCLPFLVDMGGRPQASQIHLFRHCTHALLLLRTDLPNDTAQWLRLVEDANLLPFAQITSQIEGTSHIESLFPLLKGTLTGLQRHRDVTNNDPVFAALVERITTLFTSYSSQDLEKAIFEQAPAEVLNVQASHAIAPTMDRWEPAMLQPFLEGLSDYTDLAVYGVAPNWVYAALAAQAHHAFYQFDPRLPFGWIQPLRVHISAERCSELHVEPPRVEPQMSVLSIHIPSQHLEYFQPDSLPFPPVPTDRGLIIDGKIPLWLLTALVRLYKEQGVPWIAPYYVSLHKAVVAYSRVEAYAPGDLLSLPVL